MSRGQTNEGFKINMQILFFETIFLQETNIKSSRLSVFCKGQLISKWFFGVVDFLLKTNKNKSHCSKVEIICSFLEEIEDPINHFKINWPLIVSSFKANPAYLDKVASEAKIQENEIKPQSTFNFVCLFLLVIKQ